MVRTHVKLFTNVVLLLSFLLGQSIGEIPRPRSLLDRQRRCFEKAQHCVLLLNEQGTFGCAQCEAPTISADLRVLESPDNLEDFTSNPGIIIARESTALRGQGLLRRLISTDDEIADAVILAQAPYSVNNGTSSEERVEYPPVEKFSGDATIPNGDYIFKINETVYKRPKNTHATGVQQARFPFNVFYFSPDDARELREYIANFVPERRGRFSPLFKIESRGQMEACPKSSDRPSGPAASPSPVEAQSKFEKLKESSNASVCLKDRTCSPIGGYSAWATTSLMNETTFNKTGLGQEIVAVTAPMDSTALFHDMAYGASAEIASVAALMAIVEAMDVYRQSKKVELKRHPMFFAFTAQSWGFAGSGRFLDDVMNFECKEEGYNGYCNNPVSPSLKFKLLRQAKKLVINLGGLVDPTPRQLSPILPGEKVPEPEANYSFFMHGFPKGNKAKNGEGNVERALEKQFPLTSNGLESLKISDGFRKASFADASQSFQEYAPDADVITVTNFEKNFTNPYYHSPYDNATLILPESRKPLYLVAEGIAKAVIELCYEDDNPIVKINRTVIDGFLDCLTSNWAQKNCSIAKYYLGDDEYSRMQGSVVSSNYAGIFVPPDHAPFYNANGFYKSQFLRSFMAYHTRLESFGACNNTTECNERYNTTANAVGTKPQDYTPLFCVRKECIKAESHLHAAYGTGLNATNSARSLFNVIVATPSASPSVNPEASPSPEDSIELEEPGNPAWTESVWKVDPQICYAVEDSDGFAGMVLGSGLTTFVVSLAFAAMLNKVSKVAPAVQEVDENLLPDSHLLGADQP